MSKKKSKSASGVVPARPVQGNVGLYQATVMYRLALEAESNLQTFVGEQIANSHQQVIMSVAVDRTKDIPEFGRLPTLAEYESELGASSQLRAARVEDRFADYAGALAAAALTYEINVPVEILAVTVEAFNEPFGALFLNNL